jgi:5,10-methylene-tetrahydrofolate dehydrogenase/methenyl tetrahydrofolate cyclohydrolase
LTIAMLMANTVALAEKHQAVAAPAGALAR